MTRTKRSVSSSGSFASGKHEIPVGEFEWITVFTRAGPDEVELSFEPNALPAARACQEAMFAQNIPLDAFESADIEAD